MSNNEASDILKVAQKLVDHLPEEQNKELKMLLQSAKKGNETTIAAKITVLLSKNKNIRRWMKEQIGLYNTQRSMYEPMAGWVSSVPVSWKWTCPQKGCMESFPVIQEDEPAPKCDVHNCPMKRG